MRKRATGLLIGVGLVVIGPVAANATILEWATSFERFMAGLKTVDRQVSSSASQTQQVIKKSEEAAVNAELAQEQALRLADIKNRYSYETGQGETSCAVVDARSGLSGVDNSEKKMLSAYRASDKKYLASGGNAAATIKNSLLKRIGHYCTDQEREALGPTYCQSTVRSERNAGDSNAAPFLVNRNYGGAEVVTAADYIDVLAPLPTITPEAEVIGDQLELMNARVRGAALSASRSTMMGVAVSGMGGDLQ
jgi:hypothetical protein